MARRASPPRYCGHSYAASRIMRYVLDMIAGFAHTA
uniref:Uncharacterized protein n=1 Tax=Arundo donax TaxID=35708 RepID=A0A0A9FWZ2_ARUDO